MDVVHCDVPPPVQVLCFSQQQSAKIVPDNAPPPYEPPPTTRGPATARIIFRQVNFCLGSSWKLHTQHIPIMLLGIQPGRQADRSASYFGTQSVEGGSIHLIVLK